MLSGNLPKLVNNKWIENSPIIEKQNFDNFEDTESSIKIENKKKKKNIHIRYKKNSISAFEDPDIEFEDKK